MLKASVTGMLGLSAFTYMANIQATDKNIPGIISNKKPKAMPKKLNKAKPKNAPK